MRTLSAIIIFWLATATSSSARDIYVNNASGNDSFDGARPSTKAGQGGPFRTIARALRAAERGDRIILGDSGKPYRESITLQAARHSGLARQPFEIVGNGAVLDGSQSVPYGAWKHVADGVFAFAPPRKSHQLLFLDDKPANRVVLQPGALTLPKLEPLQWCLFQREIYFRPEPNRLPDQYALSYSALPVGITLYQVRNVLIRDLTVQGFQLDGINAHDGVTNASLSELTCRGNARSGISIGGASRVAIESCLVGNNGAAQIRTEGFSHTRITGSDLLDNTAPALVREGGTVITDARQAP